MRFGVLVMFVVGTGCPAGSAGDDCQKAAAKLRPLIEERAHQEAAILPGAHLSEIEKDRAVDKLVEQCRTNMKLHPEDLKCLLAADDDAAVRACVASANQ